MSVSEGNISYSLESQVGRIEFSHPKANSLPLSLLSGLSEQINSAAADSAVKVLILQSAGEKTFCAGASFEELQRVSTVEEGKEFFLGFASVILAIKRCPKLLIARLQGKAVGGGVGLTASSDYVIAKSDSAVRLSEYELGIGPFTIGPAVERKVGAADFASMSIDCAWRDSKWCHTHGLFNEVCDDLVTLDSRVNEMAQYFADKRNSATAAIKEVIWQNTEHWPQLLDERAELSARLWIEKKSAEL